MNENDDLKSLEEATETQRFGVLRNNIAEKYGVPRACIHLISNGKKMYDSDKMKYNQKVKVEFVKPPDDNSDFYFKDSNQPKHWDVKSSKAADAPKTTIDELPPVRHISKRSVELKPTIDHNDRDPIIENKPISEIMIPPMWNDVNPLTGEDSYELSTDSGVGRIPGSSPRTSASQGNSEKENSEDFFVVSKDNGIVQSETETELRLRKRIETLVESGQKLKKHNFILQLYDARIRSRSDDLRGIVRRNFQRLMLNPDTLKNILSSDHINVDDPKKSLQFRRPIRSQPGEVSTGFQDIMDSFARMIKRWTGEDKKVKRALEDELDSFETKNKDLKADVKYWKDKSKNTKDRLRGVEKQRDDIKENLGASVAVLKDDIKEAIYQKEQLQKSLEGHEDTIDKLEKENKQLKKTVNFMETSIESLEGERKKHMESIKKNEESILKTSTRLKDVEAEKKMLDQEVADLLSEKSKLTRTSQLQWDENELLKHKLQELQERLYEVTSAKLKPGKSKDLYLPSPAYCFVLLFFAWDDIIATLTSFWGLTLLLLIGAGLYWLNVKDILHREIVQEYLDSFNQLIAKLCIRLGHRLKLIQ